MLFRAQLFRSATPAFYSAYARPAIMPLRAKIMLQGLRQSSTNAEIPKELPDDPKDDVLFSSNYGVRVVELNRPKKLNSLDGSMVRKITPRLREWESSDLANVVIMRGAGDKALCAGGDVGVLAQWNQEGQEGKDRSKNFFATEYKLDHLIATYSKPYISFMDGVTMGGGVGLSVHAPFRIATERTVFAMPETTIGFFPEVGGSFFLPRMDGSLGTYLALTSERLQGVNAFYHGVATHYLDSSALPDLEKRLAELQFRDHAPMGERLTLVNHTIEEFVTALPHDQPMILTGEIRVAIDRIFSLPTINAILSALDAETAEATADWAAKTKKTILQRSPTSVKVALRQMQLGRSWNIADAFRREYEIASQFMQHHDFTEGVTARLVRKPAEEPKWNPKTIDEVSDESIEQFFRPPEGQERLALLNEGPAAEYMLYPHKWLGLPTEEEVREYAHDRHDLPREEIVRYFLRKREGKVGVKEKVDEILARKTVVQGDGTASWVDE